MGSIGNKQINSGLRIHRHHTSPECKDWCHLCGMRKNNLSDIWYPENAEHDTKAAKYVRICDDCSYRITQAAQGLVRVEEGKIIPENES